MVSRIVILWWSVGWVGGWSALAGSDVQPASFASALSQSVVASSSSRSVNWIEQNRVQAHTRLSLPYLRRNPELFFGAGAKFRAMGATAITRSIKSGREGAWWPSSVGVVAPEARNRNLAQAVIDDARANGLRIIAYHRHMEDEAMAIQNPSWMTRTADGQPAQAPRGIGMCFNSGYANYFQVRLVELARKGVDGFYFDESHMPPTACFCENCRQRFRQETGKEPPTRVEIRSELYQDYVDFANRSIARVFRQWRNAVKAVNPNIAFLISSNRWNSFGNRHLNEELFRIADSVKTEYNVGVRRGNNLVVTSRKDFARLDFDVRFVMPWVVARDIADGRPPHIWSAGLRDEASALHATASMLAMGAIANLDVDEDEFTKTKFRSSFALGRAVSPTLGGSVPNRWLAIHLSENAERPFRTDAINRWRHVYFPAYGAFRAAYRARVPVGFVFDSQILENRLEGVRVLYLPNPSSLTSRMRPVIDAFRRRGGLVVEHQAGWTWSDPARQQSLPNEFLRTSKRLLRPSIEVLGGPPEMVNGFFTKAGRNIVTLANDASWVFTGIDGNDNANAPPATRPGPVTGVRVLLRRPTPPASVRNVVTGQALQVRRISAGFEVDVPQFQHLVVLDIQD